jgi:hypothetical protein
VTPTTLLGIVALIGSVLLCAWWILDRIEDWRTGASAAFNREVRARRRMSAVVQMSERRHQ